MNLRFSVLGMCAVGLLVTMSGCTAGAEDEGADPEVAKTGEAVSQPLIISSLNAADLTKTFGGMWTAPADSAHVVRKIIVKEGRNTSPWNALAEGSAAYLLISQAGTAPLTYERGTLTAKHIIATQPVADKGVVSAEFLFLQMHIDEQVGSDTFGRYATTVNSGSGGVVDPNRAFLIPLSGSYNASYGPTPVHGGEMTEMTTFGFLPSGYSYGGESIDKRLDGPMAYLNQRRFLYNYTTGKISVPELRFGVKNPWSFKRSNETICVTDADCQGQMGNAPDGPNKCSPTKPNAAKQCSSIAKG